MHWGVCGGVIVCESVCVEVCVCVYIVMFSVLRCGFACLAMVKALVCVCGGVGVCVHSHSQCTGVYIEVCVCGGVHLCVEVCGCV
jgi:hypothetical protein